RCPPPLPEPNAEVHKTPSELAGLYNIAPDDQITYGSSPDLLEPSSPGCSNSGTMSNTVTQMLSSFGSPSGSATYSSTNVENPSPPNLFNTDDSLLVSTGNLDK
ncbi:unnamed protein product, partial [Meganyctiphanes norvegica]